MAVANKTTRTRRSPRKQTDKNLRLQAEEQPEINEALIHLLERKRAALERFIELNQPLDEVVRAELAGTDIGRELLFSYEELGSALAATWGLVLEGQLSQAAAWRKVAPAVAGLKERMRPSLEAAYSRHADLIPNQRTMIEMLYGENAFQTNWVAEIMWLPILSLVSAPAPADAGVIQQGLDGPPPFNLCLQAPYASKDIGTWTYFLGFPAAFTSPTTGNFHCEATAFNNGGSSALTLVINDFAVPAGHTDFEVSADIDWDYFGFSMAFSGAAGVGADLLLQVDRGDGSPRLETMQPLFSLLSPVTFFNKATRSGSSKISASFSVNNPQARTIRVFAGATCHAEAGSMITAFANVRVKGTVNNICVSAV